jgi:hypothetical protein
MAANVTANDTLIRDMPQLAICIPTQPSCSYAADSSCMRQSYRLSPTQFVHPTAATWQRQKAATWQRQKKPQLGSGKNRSVKRHSIGHILEGLPTATMNALPTEGWSRYWPQRCRATASLALFFADKPELMPQF